jgi:hypothetical protein
MNYLTQRLLTFPLILLGVSVLVFVAIRLVPATRSPQCSAPRRDS